MSRRLFTAALFAACALGVLPARERKAVVSTSTAEQLIRYRAPAVLPPEVERAGITGEVVVAIEVDEQGTVRRARLISGHPLLRGPALRAVRRYRFAPLEVGGRPVRWTSVLRIRLPERRPATDPRVARLRGVHGG
ncbi:MAG: energy transducer TonB [Bryobacteraceae bacterium]